MWERDHQLVGLESQARLSNEGEAVMSSWDRPVEKLVYSINE